MEAASPAADAAVAAVAATPAHAFGLGVYSLLLLSEEGHVLLYRQISQPETVSFAGRAALRRLRAILLHNQWIGVDSTVEVTVEQPAAQLPAAQQGRSEGSTAQRASQHAQKTSQPGENARTAHCQSSQATQTSNPSLPKSASLSQKTSPYFIHTFQSPSNAPKLPSNDESQDLLAFISWEDATPSAPPPPKAKADDRKRPPSLAQPSAKRAETVQMESFLNSLFS